MITRAVKLKISLNGVLVQVALQSQEICWSFDRVINQQEPIHIALTSVQTILPSFAPF